MFNKNDEESKKVLTLKKDKRELKTVIEDLKDKIKVLERKDVVADLNKVIEGLDKKAKDMKADQALLAREFDLQLQEKTQELTVRETKFDLRVNEVEGKQTFIAESFKVTKKLFEDTLEKTKAMIKTAAYNEGYAKGITETMKNIQNLVIEPKVITNTVTEKTHTKGDK